MDHKSEPSMTLPVASRTKSLNAKVGGSVLNLNVKKGLQFANSDYESNVNVRKDSIDADYDTEQTVPLDDEEEESISLRASNSKLSRKRSSIKVDPGDIELRERTRRKSSKKHKTLDGAQGKMVARKLGLTKEHQSEFDLKAVNEAAKKNQEKARMMRDDSLC